MKKKLKPNFAVATCKGKIVLITTVGNNDYLVKFNPATATMLAETILNHVKDISKRKQVKR